MTLELAVVRFEGQETAVNRYAAARDALPYRRDVERPRWTHDVGFVERHHDGRLVLRGTFAGHYLDVDEEDSYSQKHAGEGAAVGGLIGVLAGPPGIAVGLVVGMIVGAYSGKPDEGDAEPEAIAARLREAVPRESSAIVMIAEPGEVGELLEAIGERETNTLRRALTSDEEAAIEAALSAAPRTAGGA